MSVQEQALEAQRPPVEQGALSIVDSLNVDQVRQTMARINQFQQVVRATLKEGHDYGVIPGTGDKPTLKKPGAEKILMLLGLTSEYDVVERVQDYDSGFFAFTVRCRLSRNGVVITEGYGHANTRERRYTSTKRGKEPQDPYTLANTVLKMAKKRSQVDAALTVGSLSDIFTQDLEDMAYEAEQPARPSNGRNGKAQNGGGRAASDRQKSAIRKMAYAKGIHDDTLSSLLADWTGKETVDDLTVSEASTVISELNNYEAPMSESGDGELDISEDELPF
ncbi:hypothetical protein [Alicyclobacillus kakegawensis]|uniref:hypothetical protein n=1 Tax=Alicyclobacillus kakegawensis TaxID=392012 RepID=UPI000A52D9BB|nr:hypothetical protein [Alicyclobacillus kakegawensis]